jgi:hypothetical protein
MGKYNKLLRIFASLIVLSLLMACDGNGNGSSSPNTELKKVFKVTTIHLDILKSNPPQLQIHAEGDARTGGWSNPQLIPYEYIAPPADGIYEFDFQAQPPADIATQVITPIKAGYTMNPLPDNLKGVKIYAEQNNMVALLEAKDLISDIDQTNCSDVEYCGDIGKLNCGAEVDGPLYYFNIQSEEIMSICGGACFRPDEEQQVVCETLCPPPSWDCDN